MKPHPLNTSKLHVALAQALEDLRAVEAMPDTYEVDMGAWHDATLSNKCHVCLAGAVIANRLHIPPDVNYRPTYADAENANMLFALNQLRVYNVVNAAGYVFGACDDMNQARMHAAAACIDAERELMEKRAYVKRVDYYQDRGLFYSQMEDLVQLLKKYNL